MALLAGGVLFLAGCHKAGTTTPKPADQEFRNSIGMVFVAVPPGEFYMGSDESQAVERGDDPRHLVEITRGFSIGKFEVTQQEYAKIMNAQPNRFSATGDAAAQVDGIDTSRFPVDHVSWEEAVEFCRRLSVLPAEKNAGRAYRLPTEAEWEYACRAGCTSPYSTGSTLDTSGANICAPARVDHPPLNRTTTVGSYPSNAWGLHDMHGNVWEWCGDGQREYTSRRAVDPVGPVTVAPMLRGGAWDFPAAYARCDRRQAALRGYVFFGFRVVCEAGDR